MVGGYSRFALPWHWDGGRAAIAGGTHVKLRENNLLGSRHIRHGGYGGILYRAFRELGRVERMLFLLRFVSSVEARRTIRGETTKIGAYNDFLD